MTLSAVDNPFDLIGADRSGAAEAAERKQSSGGDGSLFRKLLEGTGVQGVANAGSAQEFTETLQLHDDAVARHDRPGRERQKYDGIGLFDHGNSESAHSSRTPRKLDDLAAEDAGGRPVDVPGPKADPLPINAQRKTADTTPDDGTELAVTGIAVAPIAIEPMRTGPAPTGQNAAGGNNGRTDHPAGQDVANLAATGGKNNAATDELGRSRIASYVSRQSGNPNGNGNGPAKVTEVPEDVVSHPTSSLAASAALAAQTSRSSRSSSDASAQLAEDLNAEGRISLLDGSNGRLNGRQQTNAVQPPSKPQAPAAGPEGLQANTGQQPNPGLVNPQTLLAATAARSEVGSHSGQTIGDPLAGGPAANGSGQNAQRTHQPQVPQPPKPPVRPEQLTGQVAVQIKKAIGQGSDYIRIQLKPAELGRVEIKLEVNDKGQAVAIVTADRPDTLELLQRDAQGLRQALQDAGLSTDSNSLSFNLRGEGSKFGQEMADRGHAPDGGSSGTGTEDDTAAAEAALIAAQNVVSDGHVNVQI